MPLLSYLILKWETETLPIFERPEAHAISGRCAPYPPREMLRGKLTDELRKQLLEIEPSRDWNLNYRPASVTLVNGDIIDNVYIVEKARYLSSWGVMPANDKGKNEVLIEDVQLIRESPNRIPAQLANKLYEAGESGMGYCVFKVKFDNGTTTDVLTGNAIDFIPMPEGLTNKNVVDVLPHEGSRKEHKNGLPYFWCLVEEQLDNY